MRQALIELGLAAKGGNYKRCHKLKREFLGEDSEINIQEVTNIEKYFLI